MMKKNIAIIGIWVIILIVSIFSVSFSSKKNGKSYRSVELQQRIKEDGKTKKTVFLNEKGIITTASDLGYATVIEQQIENGKILTYYIDDGRQAFRYPGYSGRKYEYNNEDYQITYLGMNGEPVNLLLGYSREVHEFTNQGKIETVCFFNTDGNQVYSLSDGYIKQNEYDAKGRIICTSHFDENGEYMMTKRGYAEIRFSYYQSKEIGYGKVEYEFYYDEFAKPVSLSLGQFGIRRGYDENGENTIITFTDAKGKPITNNKGYSTVKIKHQGSEVIEQYYDQEGTPVSLSEGQYGILNNSDGTFFLNREGQIRFNLKNVLYNQTWIVIPTVLLLMLVSALLGRKMNIILLFLYIGVIIYLTILFRDSSTIRRQSLFGNLRYMFVDSESRIEIFRNVLLFIPLGGLLYRVYPKNGMLLVPIILSVSIECIQYFLRIGYGGFEDILTNSLGGWIGFIGEKGLLEIVHSSHSKRVARY